VTGLSDFDRYCLEHGIAPDEVPEAFADWLAHVSGQPIIGRPAGEPPTIAAVPDDDDEAFGKG
jgi:hypothetical protein